MPFEELETHHRGNALPEATLSYQCTTRTRKKPSGRPRLSISIPTTLCGTTKVKRHRLLLGSGGDTGKLRVVGVPDNAVNKSAVTPSEHAHFFRWNFGFVPRLGETTFEGQHVPVVKVDDNTWDITVPASWFDGDVE